MPNVANICGKWHSFAAGAGGVELASCQLQVNPPKPPREAAVAAAKEAAAQNATAEEQAAVTHCGLWVFQDCCGC